jgi:23S rRNA (guanosine2251-2'-O)-methyltransferase
VNPVLELLRAGGSARVARVFVAEGAGRDEVEQAARAAGVSVEHAPRHRIAELSGAEGAAHQGVVAEVAPFEYADLEELLDRAGPQAPPQQAARQPPLIVALDGVQDPHNLGAIVRSAHALGAHGVVIPQDRAAQVTPAVEKAAAGALAWCPVARVVNLARALDAMRERGLWTAGLAADGAEDLDRADLTGPLALVVGAEGTGLRRLVREKCDRLLRIPMAGPGGVGSLNASVAAALALYEVARQRRAR